VTAAAGDASPLINPKEVLGECVCTERTSVAPVSGEQGKVRGANGSLLDVSSQFRL